jgi:hypothetical protein
MALFRCDNLTGSRRLPVNYPTKAETSPVIALKLRAGSPCHRHDILLLFVLAGNSPPHIRRHLLQLSSFSRSPFASFLAFAFAFAFASVLFLVLLVVVVVVVVVVGSRNCLVISGVTEGVLNRNWFEEIRSSASCLQ